MVWTRTRRLGKGTRLGRLGQSLPLLPHLPLASPWLVAVRLLRALRRVHPVPLVATALVRPLPVSVGLVRR